MLSTSLRRRRGAVARIIPPTLQCCCLMASKRRLRKKQCGRKHRFPNQAGAFAAMRAIQKRHARPLMQGCYLCKFCHGWHWGTVPRVVARMIKASVRADMAA